jgi:DNA-binding response OmpR family regulator
MVPPRVLIVDNEPGVGFALKRLLESRAGMQVSIARSADEAEAEIAFGAIDAMILDYHLLGMRGDAFYHRACTLQPSIARRTIFITGDPSPAAEHAISQTGRPMLVKPFLASALIDELRIVTETAACRGARIA